MRKRYLKCLCIDIQNYIKETKSIICEVTSDMIFNWHDKRDYNLYQVLNKGDHFTMDKLHESGVNYYICEKVTKEGLLYTERYVYKIKRVGHLGSIRIHYNREHLERRNFKIVNLSKNK